MCVWNRAHSVCVPKRVVRIKLPAGGADFEDAPVAVHEDLLLHSPEVAKAQRVKARRCGGT
jgi:hypothetical protein